MNETNFEALSIHGILFTSSAHTLLMAALAITMVWGLLRILDILAGTPFTKVKEVIYADSKAAALYAGLRFLGACILIGLLF